MYEIMHEEVIDFPHEKAIPILFDFRNVWKIHPLVERVDFISPGAAGDHGVGAARVCNFYDGGGSVKETIIEETPNSFTVQMSEMSLPFKSGTAKLSVTPIRGGAASCVALVMLVEPKFGPLGVLMTKFVLAPKLRGAVKGLAEGILVHGRDPTVLVSKGGRTYRGTEANPTWVTV
ncbi:hypothetical protein MMPV_004442 [Pyropia vietnamensis]